MDCDNGRYNPEENICIVRRCNDVSDEKSGINPSREKNRSAYFRLHNRYYKVEVQETHY
jgi:hypothetical protein